MKTLLKLEELAMFLVCLASLIFFDVDWWWYLILFIAPDISMLGYLAGNKIGAYCYNLFHHKGIAILIFFMGVFTASDPLTDVFALKYYVERSWNVVFPPTCIVLGIALFGHSSMDRFFGFGLKTEEGFKFTHLGKIGKDEAASDL